VVVEDVLPAGFDLENPRLATSVGVLNDHFKSQATMVDARDDRLIVVGNVVHQATLGTSGAQYVFEHRYLMRAISAGTYIRPPVRAECMYDSLLQASVGTGTVVIEARAP
jgi:uncharacterized protein YfaS (alpha-2-macroglobulin family)